MLSFCADYYLLWNSHVLKDSLVTEQTLTNYLLDELRQNTEDIFKEEKQFVQLDCARDTMRDTSAVFIAAKRTQLKGWSKE